jgi:hypothetical protein
MAEGSAFFLYQILRKTQCHTPLFFVQDSESAVVLVYNLMQTHREHYGPVEFSLI